MEKKLAYFDASHECPEEILDAAGFTPFKILGDVHKSNDPADQYLNNFAVLRSKFFDLKRSNILRGLGGIVLHMAMMQPTVTLMFGRCMSKLRFYIGSIRR